MAESILIIAVVVALAYYAWRRISVRGRQMAMLISRGTVVTGKVVRTERKRLSRAYKACRVRYEFTTTGGLSYEREIEVLPKEFGNYSEGQAIDIVYDPVDPEVNALRDAVDAVR